MILRFEFVQYRAFAILKQERDFGGYANLDRTVIFFGHGQLDQSHDIERNRLGGLDQAGAVAIPAVLIHVAGQAGPLALSGKLDDSELAHTQNLGAFLVLLEIAVEPSLDLTFVFFHPHIDEIADHHAAQITQPQLSRDFVGGLEIHLVGGGFGVILGAEASAVNVDRDERLGLVDNERAAGLERNKARMQTFQFGLDSVAVEDRFGILVMDDGVARTRTEDREKFVSTLGDAFVIDDDAADVGGVDVANRPNDQIGFRIDLRRGFQVLDPFVDRFP